MAIKDGALYWTADDGVYRRDLAAARGSAPKIVDSSSAQGPIAVDGNSVYWSGVSGNPIRKVQPMIRFGRSSARWLARN